MFFFPLQVMCHLWPPLDPVVWCNPGIPWHAEFECEFRWWMQWGMTRTPPLPVLAQLTPQDRGNLVNKGSDIKTWSSGNHLQCVIRVEDLTMHEKPISSFLHDSTWPWRRISDFFWCKLNQFSLLELTSTWYCHCCTVISPTDNRQQRG